MLRKRIFSLEATVVMVLHTYSKFIEGWLTVRITSSQRNSRASGSGDRSIVKIADCVRCPAPEKA